MILVDTSVLIDFLKGENNSSVQKLLYLIERDVPFGISSRISMKVLQRAATEKDFKILYEYLSSQTFFNLKDIHNSNAQAAPKFFNLRRQGMAESSSLECLITHTAVDNNHFLLHNDRHFEPIKKVAPLKTWN